MNSNRDRYPAYDSEQRLGEVLLSIVRYFPILAGLLSLGLVGIFGLSRSGLLGESAWQVLPVAGASLLAGVAVLGVGALARRGRAQSALIALTLVMALWAVSVVVFWEAGLAVAILLLWIAPLIGIVARYERRKLIGLGLLSVVLTAVLYWLDGYPWIDRLSSSNPAGLAAVVLLASTVLLFAIGNIVVRLFRYRTLQSQLVVSFTLILAVPILLMTAISALNAFANSQAQFAESLEAISSLKQGQFASTVQAIQGELSDLQRGSGKAASLLHVLNRSSETEESYRLNASIASTQMQDILSRYPESQYDEILLLDPSGTVVLSTYAPDQGLNLSSESFVREGTKNFYTEMVRFSGKQNASGDYKLVAAAPLYGDPTQGALGVVVAVSRSNVILDALSDTTALSGTGMYLVGGNTDLISGTTAATPKVTAWPLVHRAIARIGAGVDTYANYQNASVLGYSAWDPALNALIVAEIPRSVVYNKALSTLLVSALVGIFAIIIAAIGALSTSRAISEPILRLAVTAQALADGDLGSRSNVERRDEVGKLAGAFNTMADQLQGVIGNLEQRVAERTDALERQTLRLRTAAEVARDAASAPSLEDLLDQAARLIMDRFGFYHTGIFLVDEKHEFAVLRASPSAAGKTMLANQHRLRIGEQGIVGMVAATGEPRIALDTGVDPVYFSNPFLPNTHSEMALPLKTAEGTLGVIDIQSDQPEAFTQDDIAIVRVMADQLAIAIQRTELLQQVQVQLQQLEERQQQFTKASWRGFTQTGMPNIGYRFDNVRLEPIKQPDIQAVKSAGAGSASGKATDSRYLEIPVRLRGETIGMVKLRFQSGQAPDVTAAVANQIADRLATALENARLLEESQRRAKKERAIGEITSKISASVNMRNVLQTAVEELGRALPGSDVVIQLRPDAEIQR
jgi:GAF domain-containing protein/HAMP domain-containing protein